MLYLFYGSDVEKTRAKAFEWVAKAREKEPNLAYARFAGEDLTGAALDDMARSSGLFVKRLLVLIDDPYTEHQDSFDEHLDALAASDNAIVILAPGLAPAKVKKIVAKTTKAYEFSRAPAQPARGFNSTLVNALAVRSRERLWLEIVRALRANDAPEMLHGLLHWKARDLMAKPSRAWPPGSARILSLALIALLQNSRRRGIPLAFSLERFALSI